MSKKKKSQKGNSGKGWASFRVRGIRTSLFNLATNIELSVIQRNELEKAYVHVDNVVKMLDKDLELNKIYGRS